MVEFVLKQRRRPGLFGLESTLEDDAVSGLQTEGSDLSHDVAERLGRVVYGGAHPS